MNRRGFLRFVGLGAVAAPVAACGGLTPTYANGGFVRGTGDWGPILSRENELRVDHDNVIYQRRSGAWHVVVAG